MHAPISYLRQTTSRHSPSYFSEGEICLKICNLNEMKSRQERNLHHFQNQIKLQFSSINCQFKITLLLEQCKRAATDASLLGLKGGTCGFIAAGRGCCLSHKSSEGYNCWTARSTRDVPDHSTAPLTTPSVSTLRFSTIPNGHLTLFLSSACNMTMSPTAGAFPWLVFWVRSLSRRARRYSLDQRRHTAPCTCAGALLVSDSRLFQYGVAVTLAGHYYS